MEIKLKYGAFFGIILLMLFACGKVSNSSIVNSSIMNITSEDNQIYEGVGYSIVHKDYVGCATIKVKNNKAIEITIDEAFLPFTWARLKNDQDFDSETMYKSSIDNYLYAKYIKIDTMIFTCEAYHGTAASQDGTTKQKVKYVTNDIPNLFTYLKESDENRKWYYEALKNQDAFICDKDGKKINISQNNEKLFKSEGGYWEVNNGLGWKGNMEELINGMIGTSIENEPSKNSDGYVTFGDIVTGATNSDYLDYYNLVKKAYENAIKK